MSEVRVNRTELKVQLLESVPVMIWEHVKDQVEVFLNEYDSKTLTDSSWYVSSLSYDDLSVKIRGNGEGKFMFTVKEW